MDGSETVDDATESKSPSKYDGYSAYLSSLPSPLAIAIHSDKDGNGKAEPTRRDLSPLPLSASDEAVGENSEGHDDSCQVPKLLKGFENEKNNEDIIRSTPNYDRNLAGEINDQRNPDHDLVVNHDQEIEELSSEDIGRKSREEPPQWEDFMAHYWKLPIHANTPTQNQADEGNSASTCDKSNSVSPKFQIHAHAQSVLLSEDIDLKPCPIEPELDEEPFLSPIRIGCIDIDIDDVTHVFSKGVIATNKEGDETYDGTDHEVELVESIRGLANADFYPIKELSNFGIESSRIMAKLQGGEIHENALAIATPVRRNLRQQTDQQQISTAPLLASPNSASTSSLLTVNLLTQDATMVLFDHALSSQNSFEADKRSTTSNTNTNKSTSSEVNVNDSDITEWPHKICPLPSINLIHSIGPIMTRTSLRSLVMKKWNAGCWWMHFGGHSILIFRSKDHLDDWRFNPYHGKRQREYLVKLKIDFFSEMVAGAGNSEKDGGGTGVFGHRLLPIKRKSYGKNDPEIYQFKLERWTSLGVSVLAAFASQEESEVQLLYDTISKILKSCPHGGLRNIDHMLTK